MGTIRAVRDPHNLSHSRIKGVLSCAARVGYEGLYEEFRRWAAPYWLAGGAAVHHMIDELLKRTAVIGKILPVGEVDLFVDQSRKFIWNVLSGKCPPSGFKDNLTRRHLSIFWMSEDEYETRQLRNPEELQKNISGKINRYRNQVTPGLRAMALRATVPSPFPRTMNAVRFDNKLALSSPRDSSIQIPIYGELDVLEQHPSGGLIITDWKTGNFNNYLQEDLEGNEQMLIYWHAIRELYGVDPMIAYFVSLSVNKWDLEKYGASVLEREQYRVQARIRFEEHFPEFVKEADDVWAMLNFLAHPPSSDEQRYAMEIWQPSSAAGKRVGLQYHVEQGRLIPSIGRHCGMCPAKRQCQADNPEDWQQYEARQKLGNVVDQLAEIPEDWLDPFPSLATLPLPAARQEQIFSSQLRLFEPKHVREPSAVRKSMPSAKEFKARGYLSDKELLAVMRRMHSLIPVVNGVVCPCKRSKRIPPFLRLRAWEFFLERESHKQVQEAQGKTRSGKGEYRVKELYDSQVVRELLTQCTIEDCPFACKTEVQQAG